MSGRPSRKNARLVSPVAVWASASSLPRATPRCTSAPPSRLPGTQASSITQVSSATQPDDRPRCSFSIVGSQTISAKCCTAHRPKPSASSHGSGWRSTASVATGASAWLLAPAGAYQRRCHQAASAAATSTALVRAHRPRQPVVGSSSGDKAIARPAPAGM